MSQMTSVPIGLRPDLGFLLSNFEREMPGATRTVAVSVDGLVQCASDSVLSREQAEYLAAICSGMASMVTALAQQLDAGPNADIGVRLDVGFVLIAGPFDNVYLLTLAHPSADMGEVNAGLVKLGGSVRDQMSPAARTY